MQSIEDIAREVIEDLIAAHMQDTHEDARDLLCPMCLSTQPRRTR